MNGSEIKDFSKNPADKSSARVLEKFKLIFVRKLTTGMHYKISYTNPRHHFIDIEFIVENVNSEILEIQLPSWRPGRYELQNFAKNIQKWIARSETGEILISKKISKDKWEVQTKGNKKVYVFYNYYAAQLDAGACWLDETQLYINPVHLCLYVPEKINEACTVELNIPSEYKIATSLSQKNNELYAADFLSPEGERELVVR